MKFACNSFGVLEMFWEKVERIGVWFCEIWNYECGCVEIWISNIYIMAPKSCLACKMLIFPLISCTSRYRPAKLMTYGANSWCVTWNKIVDEKICDVLPKESPWYNKNRASNVFSNGEKQWTYFAVLKFSAYFHAHFRKQAINWSLRRTIRTRDLKQMFAQQNFLSHASIIVPTR